MPEVIVEAIPAKSSATANMIVALLPSSGRSSESACWSSVTGVFDTKKVAAASRIIALLMAQPITIERIVSTYSYRSCFFIIFSSLRFHWRLWMISECRKRLCGITTAPSTLMMMTIDPSGKDGVTHAYAAAGQSIVTSDSS